MLRVSCYKQPNLDHVTAGKTSWQAASLISTCALVSHQWKPPNTHVHTHRVSDNVHYYALVPLVTDLIVVMAVHHHGLQCGVRGPPDWSDIGLLPRVPCAGAEVPEARKQQNKQNNRRSHDSRYPGAASILVLTFYRKAACCFGPIPNRTSRYQANDLKKRVVKKMY